MYRNTGQADESWNIYPWGRLIIADPPSVGCVYYTFPLAVACAVCVCVPPATFLGGRGRPVAEGHVWRYGVTVNVTSPVVAETNNEEDRADV
jgi:hypothetical protein